MASNLVIVAIPSEDDHVWKISSEKKPHMTICFLGDSFDNPNVLKIQEFLEHAVNTWEQGPFGLDVEERGTLGDDDADVLFFRKGWYTKKIEDFRAQLLLNDAISRAALVNDQYPEWIPHLTLGYPATPAKKDTREYPGLHWVQFDKIALWTGDYEGPEFKLKYNYDWDSIGMDVAMSEASDAIDGILEHYGVKGMKWGRRRGPQSVSVKPGRRSRSNVRTKGGKHLPAHEEAITAAIQKQMGKKSSTDALSTKELQSVVQRMNLEQQFKSLSGKQKNAGKKYVADEIQKNGKEQMSKAVAQKAAKAAIKIGLVTAVA